ncbi:MAG: hypothetical protein U9P44_04255, partial [archaeon]|nr:hypothetical protein [archaeon]
MFTDNQIKNFVDGGLISVMPAPVQKQFQPASLDWRIGAVEIFDKDTICLNQREYWKMFSETAEENEDMADFVKYIDGYVDSLGGNIKYLERDEPFIIEPGQQAMVYSLEQFRIPDGLAVFSELRSSNGRRGLSPVDGFVQDLSYEGRIQMSVVNKNPNSLRLYGGDRFAQLFFELKNQCEFDM